MSSTREAKVTFKAETSEFESAISGANKELSSLRAEMKLNEAQFKNTGDESEYYQTKLSLLEEELEANREKQEALRSEIEVAKEVFGENSDEVKNLETSLTYAQIQEENMKGQVEDATSAMDGQSDAAEGSADSFESFCDVVAASGIADAISDIADAAYELAESFDEAEAAIVEGTGATGEALEELADTAESAFVQIADSDTSLSDVSSTLAELNTRFGVTGDEAEELTVTITNFANHCDTDAVTAVDEVADVIARWGLDVSDVDGLLDDLTTANQSCSLSVDDLTGYLSSNSVQFQELGYGTEDALALLVSLSDGGANVSTVMSGMTKAVSNLSDVTDDVPGAFQDAVDAIADCDSVSEALQTQVGDTGLTVEDVFGTKAAQELAANILNGNFAIEEWTEVLEDNEGALEDTTEGSTTMGDEWSQAMNSISTSVGSIFSPAISEVVSAIAGVITDIGTVISESPALQAVIVAVAAVLGVLAVALAISSLIQGVQSAFSLLNTTLLSNPITLVVAAIAALVAGIIYAYNNCEEFREIVDAAFAAIKEAISAAIEVAKEIIAAFMDAISSAGETVGEFLATVQETFENIKTAISEKVSAAKETISETFENIKTAISEKITAAKEVVAETFENIKTAISEKLESAKETVTGIFDDIKTAISDKIEAAKETVSDVIDKIKGIFDFEWSLPSLKLPHVTISGEFSLSPLSVPSFGISWYAEGGVLNGATIFGALGSTLLGGGEAGPEAVAPIETLQSYIVEAVDAGSGTDRIVAAIETLADRVTVLEVDGQRFATATAGAYDSASGTRQTYTSRGLAI